MVSTAQVAIRNLHALSWRMDPYEELGVARDASVSAIMEAHRRAVKAHHPDAGGDRACFDRAQQAYEVLTDEQRRKRFDETGVCDAAAANTEQAVIISVAREALMSLILGPADLARIDLIGGAMELLSEKIGMLRQQRAGIDRNLPRILNARDRLHSADPMKDVLRSILDWQQAELCRSGLAIDRTIGVHDSAIAFLKGYTYRMDYSGGDLTVSREGDTLNIVISRGEGTGLSAPHPGLNANPA